MRVSTRRSADSGVSADGLRMTALPPAMAGPSLWATRLRGSLNGVMAAMMPSGSRVNQPCRFSEPSIGVEGDDLAGVAPGFGGGQGRGC